MITSEIGIMGTTVKFVKTYKSGRAISVIMTNDEVEELGGIEKATAAFKNDWKAAVRRFDLLVEAE